MRQPRQTYWKPQHEVFIRCMLKHEDPTQAYRTAYPKARPASARVGGHRLYSYPHIRQRIEPLLEERRAEKHKRALEEGVAREKRARECRMEMRHMLYKVMIRQLKKIRNFTVNGQQVTIEDDPSIGTILNALVLDQRLEAGYDNWPLIERRFARIMASLLPCEKRVQPNASELVNANEKTFFHEQTVTNSSASSIVTVISSGAKQSVAQGEISREYAIGNTAAPQEISPDGRNDALIFPVQTVAISPTNPAQAHPVRNLTKARITRAVTKIIWTKHKETG